MTPIALRLVSNFICTPALARDTSNPLMFCGGVSLYDFQLRDMPDNGTFVYMFFAALIAGCAIVVADALNSLASYLSSLFN